MYLLSGGIQNYKIRPKIVTAYDQEIPKSQTAAKPTSKQLDEKTTQEEQFIFDRT